MICLTHILISSAGYGGERDILETHQSRRGEIQRLPSQDHLRRFSDGLYSKARAARTSSQAPSRVGSVHSSSFISGCSEASGSSLGDSREVVKKAATLLAYDMAVSIGWPIIPHRESTRTVWKDAVLEVWNQACSNEQKNIPINRMLEGSVCVSLPYTLCTDLHFQILKHMTAVRGRMAMEAQPYAAKFLSTSDETLCADPERFVEWKRAEVARITRTTVVNTYFMHELDQVVGPPRFSYFETHIFLFRRVVLSVGLAIVTSRNSTPTFGTRTPRARSESLTTSFIPLCCACTRSLPPV